MKLNRTQWIVVSGAVIMLLGIYLFADMKKPAKEKPAPMANRDAAKEAGDFDWEGYVKKVKANITSADTLKLVENWEKRKDNKNLIALYHMRGESVMEAHYSVEAALGGKDKDLMVRAGDLYGATSAISNDESLHKYLIDNAVECYQQAVTWDSSNTENRLKLATAYMDQGSAPMQGVTILLDVVNKDPNNADAQMLLGKFGIVSGQYDKAIGRLEKVVSLRPQNYDALFLLAEAYRGKGDKAKAVELLRKCVKLVDKPELKKEIEQYITKIQSGS